MVSLGGDPSSVARHLKDAVCNLEELAGVRAALEDEVRRTKDADNIAAKLMTVRGCDVQSLFDTELAKYEPLAARGREATEWTSQRPRARKSTDREQKTTVHTEGANARASRK